MASESDKQPESGGTPPNGDEKNNPVLDGIDESKSRAPRHQRWTRQETIVLIQGKTVVEGRAPSHRGRRPALGFGPDQPEPKWDSVALYCRENGVNRESFQCRKRWSNLVGDFKKIKTWESQVKEEAESFWMMRNDLRKQHKLPGFFDREVYDVLDGSSAAIAAVPLTMILPVDSETGNGVKAASAEEEENEAEVEVEAEAVFDSGRQATTEDGLFSDFEQSVQEAGWNSDKENMVIESTGTKKATAPLPIPDIMKEKPPSANTCRESISQGQWKRRRLSFNGSADNNNVEDKLISVLERNSSMMKDFLEAQNVNCQLNREQQKEHTDSIVTVLNKLADALVKIAEKL